MAGNVVDIVASGIKCDASGCDYREEVVALDAYESYVDRPCPKCGASLLTPEDYAATTALLAIAEWANATLESTGGPKVKCHVEMNGSGIPIFSSEK